MNKNKIIFTDLDESLLKDNLYYPKVLNNFVNNLLLQKFNIVVCTSKTYQEVLSLFKKNKIKFPFSTENGANFYIPVTKDKKDLNFKKIKNKKALNTNKINLILRKLSKKYTEKIIFIRDLEKKEQIEITRLSKQELPLFLNRESSVSVIWNGNKKLLNQLKKSIKSYNLQFLFGGKIINVSGLHNKLDSVKYFEKYFIQISKIKKNTTISVGDSQNDIEMLNYTDYSGIVKRSDNKNIKLIKNQDVFISNKVAPEGWVELISLIKNKMEKENS